MGVKIGGTTLKGVVAEKYKQGHFDYHLISLKINDLANRRIGIDTKIEYLGDWLLNLDKHGLKDFEIEFFTIRINEYLKLLKVQWDNRFNKIPKLEEFKNADSARFYYMLMFHLNEYEGDFNSIRSWANYISFAVFKKEVDNTLRDRVYDRVKIFASNPFFEEKLPPDVDTISKKYNHTEIQKLIDPFK